MIQKTDNGLVLGTTVVFSCGCGGSPTVVRQLLRGAAVDVPILLTKGNLRAKAYIKEHGLNIAIPALAKPTHGVLYNPKTQKFINLLRAPRNDNTYSNIRAVVDGR